MLFRTLSEWRLWAALVFAPLFGIPVAFLMMVAVLLIFGATLNPVSFLIAAFIPQFFSDSAFYVGFLSPQYLFSLLVLLPMHVLLRIRKYCGFALHGIIGAVGALPMYLFLFDFQTELGPLEYIAIMVFGTCLGCFFGFIANEDHARTERKAARETAALL